jgi:restriction system protein
LEISADRKAFADHYISVYPITLAGKVRANASQLFRFVHEMKCDDLVVYPSKVDKQIHIGRIVGDYQFTIENKVAYPHRRAVTWLKAVQRTYFTQGALYETGAAMSIFQVKNFADEFVAVVEASNRLLLRSRMQPSKRSLKT